MKKQLITFLVKPEVFLVGRRGSDPELWTTRAATAALYKLCKIKQN